MLKSQFISVAVVIVVTAYITGCAGAVARPVSASDRDTTGSFDGIWQVDVAKGAGVQYVQDWEFTCNDMSDRFEIIVEDGRIVSTSEVGETTSYVSSTGSFKIALPVAGEASASGQSDTSIVNGKLKLLLSGDLGRENPVGYFTVGIAEFGYAGCTSKVKYKKLLRKPTDKKV